MTMTMPNKSLLVLRQEALDVILEGQQRVSANMHLGLAWITTRGT